MAKEIETPAAKRKATLVGKQVAKRIMDIDKELLVTSDYIANQYGKGVLDVDDMADFMKIKRTSVLQKIAAGTMPFKVTKLGDQWITTPYSIADYIIQNQQNRGIALKEAG